MRADTVQALRANSQATGEKIVDAWRHDAETDTSLNLTYLPLGQSQTLAKTATSAAGSEDENQKGY